MGVERVWDASEAVACCVIMSVGVCCPDAQTASSLRSSFATSCQLSEQHKNHTVPIHFVAATFLRGFAARCYSTCRAWIGDFLAGVALAGQGHQGLRA
jgi:hypothetical protein